MHHGKDDTHTSITPALLSLNCSPQSIFNALSDPYVALCPNETDSFSLTPQQVKYNNEIYNSVYCKSFEVEKFCGFCGLICNCETYPVK